MPSSPSIVVLKMKSILALAFLPLIASGLKVLPQSRETYASYAARNGIVMEKAAAPDYQYLECYDYFGQQGTTWRYFNYFQEFVEPRNLQFFIVSE